MIHPIEELLDIEESRRRSVKEKEKKFSVGITYRYISAFMYNQVSVSDEERYRLAKDIAGTITPEEVKKRVGELLAPVNMSLGLALPSWQKKAYKKESIMKWYESVIAEDIQPYTREELKKGTDYSKLEPAKIVEREDMLRESGA